MGQAHKKLYVSLIYPALILAAFVAFEQVRQNKFVNYDDPDYVTENRQVQAGMTAESVRWAFTTIHAANWHPVTWLSHMLDCQLFGLSPQWHHLSNLLLHIANSLLLFWILKKMTGAVWASALVAAVFALHPLHVESVAWVAERKDVLSGLFWMLTIAAYIRYAKEPGIGRYALVFVVFALGLMAKPMLVTLPFVLILLDYWPLERFRRRSLVKGDFKESPIWRLVVEKVPLLILVAGSCVITFVAQQNKGAMTVGSSFSLGSRVTNAICSYQGYIVKMFYPSRLAVLYPHPEQAGAMWQVIVSLLVLAVISVGVILGRRRHRYLAAGWLWYLGTLVPVVGLVQVGAQAMADRYTYLPSIGIFIMVVWGVGELLGRHKTGLGVLAGVVLVVLMILTRVQVGRWKDSATLFRYTLEVTEDNYIMHNYYGRALRKQGRLDEAVEEIQKSLGLNPNYHHAYNNLGITLQGQGKFDEAEKEFRKALELKPDFPRAHDNLGIMLAKRGDLDEAIGHFARAIELNPASDSAHNNMAQALYFKGDTAGAIKHYRQSLRLAPGSSSSLIGLSQILATSRKAEFRDGIEAVRLAKKAGELTNYENPEILDVLAAAYAEMGDFAEAVNTAQRAIDLCVSLGKSRLARDITNREQLYRKGEPYRRK